MADEKLLDTCSNTGSKQPHESRLFNPKMKYQGDPSNLWPTLKGDAVSDFILKNSGAGDWMTVIVGDDDRQPADGSVFPFRCILQLRCLDRYGAELATGTGFLISPTCIITAGHCVYDNGQWMGSIEVVPSTKDTLAPNAPISSTVLRSVRGWVHDRNDLHDHGAVILPDSSLYQKIGGHFGFTSEAPDPQSDVDVAGFAEDKFGYLNVGRGQLTSVEDYLIYHTADTKEGDSGSPVFDPSDRVLGVHTFGSDITHRNQAVRVRPEVAKIWQDWTLIKTT